MAKRIKNWSVRCNKLIWEHNGKLHSAKILERCRGYYVVGSTRFSFKVYVAP